jgi:DNA-binding Lrp family transcriptional regulator
MCTCISLPDSAREEEAMSPLTAAERALLNRIQSNFPLTPRPFRTIAVELGRTEKEVLDSVSRLRERGIIRRIGGNFVPEKLGFVSTLCAARVPAHKIALFTEAVNRYPGVTHNYQRENAFNIWFTFIAPSMVEIERNLEQIAAETGVEGILNLPATKVYKIKAQFDL